MMILDFVVINEFNCWQNDAMTYEKTFIKSTPNAGYSIKEIMAETGLTTEKAIVGKPLSYS